MTSSRSVICRDRRLTQIIDLYKNLQPGRYICWSMMLYRYGTDQKTFLTTLLDTV